MQRIDMLFLFYLACYIIVRTVCYKTVSTNTVLCLLVAVLLLLYIHHCTTKMEHPCLANVRLCLGYNKGWLRKTKTAMMILYLFGT